MSKHLPLIFIISAPSGTGKGTLVKQLLEQVPRLERITTTTTRSVRPGEIAGKSYIFISQQQFRDLIEKDAFVEWNHIFDNYYGTFKETVYGNISRAQKKGGDLVVEIDVDGKRNFMAQFSNTVSIFLLPPSIEDLKKRILHRNSENPAEIDKRLSRAAEEISRKDEFDYQIVNDQQEETLGQLKNIVETERSRRDAKK